MKTLLAIAALAAGGCSFASAPDDADERDLWRSRTEIGLDAAAEGRAADAERELLAAVAALTVVEGNEARLVASLNLLARLYRNEGRRDSAESALRKALAFAEEKLGADHPGTIETRRAGPPARPAAAGVPPPRHPGRGCLGLRPVGRQRRRSLRSPRRRSGGEGPARCRPVRSRAARMRNSPGP